MSKEKVDLVLSGSGTLAPCHVGALSILDKHFSIQRVAGTSGGAIVAAAYATGYPDKEMREIAAELFNGRLLDPSMWPLKGWGLNKGIRVHKLLTKYLPEKMEQTRIPLKVFAADLTDKKVVCFSSGKYPVGPVEYPDFILRSGRDLFLADVVRASVSIPLFFRASKIRGLENDRLFVDGGLGANEAASVWDDQPKVRTILINFCHTPNREPVRTTTDYAQALFNILFDSANDRLRSAKSKSDVISIRTKGDGMDFTLSSEELARLFKDGEDAVRKFYGIP